MCAQIAAQRGRKVLVLERANKIGKKILMSGGGRCNFTNLDVQPENYISHNPHFVISALNRYTQWDFLSLVGKYQIGYEERKHGQLFCLNSAKDILNMLLEECEQAGVSIKTSQDIVHVDFSSKQQLFTLKTQQAVYQCTSLVVATGGLSIPTLGGSGFGYELAKQFGHHVYPTRAGLVPFTFSDQFKAVTERLSGIATEVNLFNDQAGFTENLLFTHRGLSGPCALQLSNYWKAGHSILIDFFTGFDLEQWLLDKKQQQPKTLLRTVLQEHLAKNLIVELQQLLWATHSERPLNQWPDKDLKQLVQQLHHFEQKPSGTEGYRTAEVTLGGVDTAELSSKTMESKKQKGLYFIGEVVDVTGHLGGYNFQWAWSSGVAAGQVV
ncbi:NAD(P)/FAD-dependent oxidoreductase [Alkanindiges sp. WGS2144]|uniref:NAD(P)/FAD-dependent oxidoreductase n=1 Tax=Alkanindiges sp. WGS2144 TaxID=3366808 RepID=UPI0037533AFA